MAESHPNRTPGTDELVSEVARSTDASISAWWDRLNLLSQDIWTGSDDPERKAIAEKAGELAVEHAMALSTTLRDLREMLEPLIPSMPEGESKREINELLKRAYELCQ